MWDWIKGIMRFWKVADHYASLEGISSLDHNLILIIWELKNLHFAHNAVNGWLILKEIFNLPGKGSVVDSKISAFKEIVKRSKSV